MTSDSSPAISVTDHVSEGEAIALLTGNEYSPRSSASNDNSSIMPRTPRPKIFMYPAPEETSSDNTSPYLSGSSRETVIPRNAAERSFDWKFAALLIAVVVAVNAGLMWLFSEGDQAHNSVMASKSGILDSEGNTIVTGKSGENDVEAVVIKTENNGAAVPATDLAPSAGLPPAAAPRITAATPATEAVPPAQLAPPAPEKSGPVPSRTVDDQQELLSILNRF